MTKRRDQLKLAFASTWPLEKTMVFERLFHPNLRSSLCQKRDLLKNAIAVWMYDATRGTLVGEIYSTPAEEEMDPNEEGYADIAPYRNRQGGVCLLNRYRATLPRSSAGAHATRARATRRR